MLSERPDGSVYICRRPAPHSHTLEESDKTKKNSVVRGQAGGYRRQEQFKSPKVCDVSHVTALITGGGSGIGLTIVQALVANGAKVYITGLREGGLATVEKRHDMRPGSIIP